MKKYVMELSEPSVLWVMVFFCCGWAGFRILRDCIIHRKHYHYTLSILCCSKC